ncbi:hypothetical protein GGS24DRAFT_514264 [Hypoxylon argillaceum]|nr:hypothetical protein GGS24DRAFT_514264 [Hypoxylon argillaceum]
MPGNLEDSYTPNWAPYFTEDGQLRPDVTVSVECAICRLELAIASPVDADHESFAMLPCGHVFGHACIIQWLYQSDTPTCPQCRRNMRHSVCRHITGPRAIQGGPRFNRRRDLPPALASAREDGGLLGGCATCEGIRERDARINAMIPHHVPPRDLWLRYDTTVGYRATPNFYGFPDVPTRRENTARDGNRAGPPVATWEDLVRPGPSIGPRRHMGRGNPRPPIRDSSRPLPQPGVENMRLIDTILRPLEQTRPVEDPFYQRFFEGVGGPRGERPQQPHEAMRGDNIGSVVSQWCQRCRRYVTECRHSPVHRFHRDNLGGTRNNRLVSITALFALLSRGLEEI